MVTMSLCHCLAGTDYGTSVGVQRYSVTFPAGSRVQTFTVNTLSDDVWEFNETFSLIIQEPSVLGLTRGNPRETQITIIDTTGTWLIICVSDFYKYDTQFCKLNFLLLLSWEVKHQDQ